MEPRDEESVTVLAVALDRWLLLVLCCECGFRLLPPMPWPPIPPELPPLPPPREEEGTVVVREPRLGPVDSPRDGMVEMRYGAILPNAWSWTVLQ
jgi:hypothetical protein